MFLSRIVLAGFKNYSQAEFNFHQKINCLVGYNGMGKTNLLDAIHYLSFCKSFFNVIDTQNIRHDEPQFSITGTFEGDGGHTSTVQCIQKRGAQKQFRLNKKEYERLADHIGQFPLVMISPADSNLILNGSEDRRKFLDSFISQFDKVYLDNLISYNKSLYQRNRLLKSFAEKRHFDRDSLEIWDEKLIHLGTKIHSVRNEFISPFLPIFRKYYNYISNGNEEVDLMYESGLNSRSFSDLLRETLDDDRRQTYTTTGIHKDDLSFTIRGYPLKKFGSQGQQKSFTVAVKLAQFEYISMKRGVKPLLLLDDIFDKLDDHRVEKIMTLASENNFGQVFITDTHLHSLRNAAEGIGAGHRIFLIENGVPELINGN
jgi:DNA replication and repair protein RecF